MGTSKNCLFHFANIKKTVFTLKVPKSPVSFKIFNGYGIKKFFRSSLII
jgi:hypothetical protein